MVSQGLKTSVIGRAVEKGLIRLDTVNIRDFTLEKHGRVDDYPYGGGAGMLMQAQPVYDAWRSVCGAAGDAAGPAGPVPEKGTGRLRTVYVTPQGEPFTQQKARELAGEEELIILCGHYEGIDERVLEETVTDRISIGDYVLTGGELAAMVIVDAVSRLVPGVLGNETSAEAESFHGDLLEYPQYSRPEVWHGKRVPEVLLSGNHARVGQWRREQAEARTAAARPDLYGKYCGKQQLIRRLAKEKRNHIHIMESLARGRGEILWQRGGDLAVWDREASVCMLLAESEASAGGLLGKVPREAEWIVVCQDFLTDRMEEYEAFGRCGQYLYTSRETLPVRFSEIRRLSEEDASYVIRHDDCETEDYIRERIRSGMMYGAFWEGRQIGFIGVHREGSAGMLYVEEGFRRRGAARALTAYCVNRHLEKGWIPYGQVKEGNLPSERLLEKLGFYRASRQVCRFRQK